MKISDSIPSFYHQLFADFINLEVPPEPFADCSDCPIICQNIEDVGKDKSKPFSPETKCCTFSPRIPNYMVGAILSDINQDNMDGKNRILKAIKSRKGIFPNGVYPTKKYKLLYEAARNDSFGRSKSLMCPYFIAGEFNCTIWKYREAICALWFCKHLAGNKGYDFWNSLIEFMKSVQENLIAYCFFNLGVSPFDPYTNADRISYEDLEDLPMKESEYVKIWGEWVEKEEEFYVNCYDLVRKMDSDFFKNLMGIDYEIGLSKIKNAHQNMIELPEFMVISDDFNQVAIDGFYTIELNHFIERIDSSIAYSFPVPSFIIDSFNGSNSTESVIKNIFSMHSIVLEKEILIALYQHGVLKKV